MENCLILCQSGGAGGKQLAKKALGSYSASQAVCWLSMACCGNVFAA